ncbi:MAG: conserved exported protein of unknown function [Nitrospira sp.]|nr:MAG: conserved exported protein of unknown function [Nitrospira sp.]
MTMRSIAGSAAILLALTATAAHADDICLGDEEEKSAKAQVAALRKAEQAGSPAALFVAYRSIMGNDCVDRYDKAAFAAAKANLSKLGRDLAKAAEAKGLFYSPGSIRPDGNTSAFTYFEAIGEYTDANRVMLKAAQAAPEDLSLFKSAWNVDQNRSGLRDAKTGERAPYASPPAYRQELAKLASTNADRLMKAEEKDAPGLSGNAMAVTTSTMSSLQKLRTAAEWMKYLPSGDKPAKDRADQRGDTIMKRSDPTFTQMNASAYYEFSGSPKGKEIAAQIKKKGEDSQRALEKAGDKMRGAITEQSADDQKKFDKKKADLEKELGF